MDAKTFFKEFNDLFIPGSETYKKAVSTYPDNTAYTKFIMEQINNIIKETNDLKLKKSNEYFRIDAIGYTSRYEELVDNGILKRHLWDLEIAVEHENDNKDWLDEVIKLAHVCCPLRVTIGYVPCCNKRENNDQQRLDYASDALKKLKCQDNLKTGEFMVILGNSNTKGQEERYFHYRAYILEATTFKFVSLEKYLNAHNGS